MRPASLFGAGATAVAVMLLSGCGNSLPKVKSLEGKKPPGPLLNAASEVFDTRLAKSGGSYFTVIVNTSGDYSSMLADAMKQMADGNAEGMTEAMEEPKALILNSMELVELKNLRTVTTQHELTEADRLNDIKWKGVISVVAEVQRRKQLDLTSALSQAVEDQENGTQIPWTDRKLTWVAVGTPEESAKNGEENSSEDAVLGANWLTAALGGLSGESFEATDWGDWTTAEDASFQYSEATLRGKNAILQTNESAEVLNDKDIVFHRIDGEQGGMGFLSALTSSSTAGAFLLKPDLNALRKAGVLD